MSNDLIRRTEALKCAEMDSEIYIAIDNLPTVEAIPIEWIKKWNQKNENFLLYMGLARKLIEDWEKENETV